MVVAVVGVRVAMDVTECLVVEDHIMDINNVRRFIVIVIIIVVDIG